MKAPSRKEEALWALALGGIFYLFCTVLGVLIPRAVEIELSARATATVEALQMARSHARTEAANVVVVANSSEPPSARPAPEGR